MNDLQTMEMLSKSMKCCKTPDYRPKTEMRGNHVDCSRGCMGRTFRCQSCGSECYVPYETKECES